MGRRRADLSDEASASAQGFVVFNCTLAAGTVLVLTSFAEGRWAGRT